MALDAMGGDPTALKLGQTLADKFRQAGNKKETFLGFWIGSCWSESDVVCSSFFWNRVLE